LKDTDSDFQRSALRKSLKGRVARKSIAASQRTRSRTTSEANDDDDDEEEEPKPKPVRRQSIARNLTKVLPEQKDPEVVIHEKFPDNLVVTARVNIFKIRDIWYMNF